MGESTSDYLVHRFNPELAVLTVGVVFVVSLANQLYAPRFLVGAYWWAVVMVGVFGTMCADVAHVALHVPYDVSTVSFALVLAAVFAGWRRVEGTLAMNSVSTARRELFYWAAVVTTFALGTAVGDLTAYTLGLGYARSIALFALAILVPVALSRLRGAHRVALFWSAYVLTRPLGASVADYLGKAREVGGLNLGAGKVALALSAAIVLAVAPRGLALARARRP
ncbi:MAG: hypothetical protein KGJ36_03790 [Acidobacteriota bacterium]|nr:hypothetical protein [Acidobacteriota bacterium]